MRVIRAESMGICFGVRDALAAAANVDTPAAVTIFGELVHNPSVRAELDTRGFRHVPETGRDEAPIPTRRVLLTAHGVSDATRHRLRAAGHDLIDTTCPLVRKVHAAALALQREGRSVVIIGQPGHVEVRGITEDLARFDVVPTPQHARAYDARRLGVLCQSTTAPDDAGAVLAAVRRLNPHADIRFIDTICAPTRARQQAMTRLLDAVDAVVVVGGPHSNNTLRLVALCEARGVRACRVADADELRPDWFTGCDTLGLTAGTSTPDDAIDRVERTLQSF